MFRVAHTFSRPKSAKHNIKATYKLQNTFSVTHKFNKISIIVANQQRFYSEEKRPEEEDDGPIELKFTGKKEKIKIVEELDKEAIDDKRDNELFDSIEDNNPPPAVLAVQRVEELNEAYRKAQFEYDHAVRRERRVRDDGTDNKDEIMGRIKQKRAKNKGQKKEENEEKKEDKPKKEYTLMGEYLLPDIYAKRRRPDGKIYDDEGKEIPVNPKTGFPIPVHVSEHENESIANGELSNAAKRRMLRLDDERHERNIRELRYRALQVSTAMGMQGARYRADSLPVEELKKVWNYVRDPNPQKPISTVVFNYNAGDIDDSYYKTGDPLIVYFRRTRFFRKHPEQKYVYLAGIFVIGVAIAIAIAILDAFTLDHSDQQDKDKNYFRARLISSFGYTVGGAGATLLFTRLFASSLLKSRRLDLTLASLCSFPIFGIFLLGHNLNFPENSSVGKVAMASGLSASAGLVIASHSLKRGTGLVRLLVPVLFSTTALSASLAISPFNFNLEYGVPLAVVSATLAGMFGASAIFNPYRNKTRAVLGSTFALTYAGLLLSQTQPYLNNIKFQENYYGADAYGHDSKLLLKTFFFIPLKAIDIVADQNSKRDLFQ